MNIINVLLNSRLSSVKQSKVFLPECPFPHADVSKTVLFVPTTDLPYSSSDVTFSLCVHSFSARAG